MRKRTVAFLLLALTLVGCAGPAVEPGAEAQGREEQGQEAEAQGREDQVGARVTDPPPPAPVWHQPDTPLTEDLSTYAPEPRPSWPRGLERPGQPASLAQLVQHLEAGNGPALPLGVGAIWLGTLSDGSNGYHLGGMVRPDQDKTFLLRKEGEEWVAAPICREMTWFWPGTIVQQAEPSILCARVEGSGGMLSVEAYVAGRQVLHVEYVRDGGLVIQERPDGPPDLMITGAIQWMDHKLDPTVTERYTFIYEDGEYRMAKHERAETHIYHLARFLRFLAAGDLTGATGEMGSEPAGGLSAYLNERAPDLQRLAGTTWTTDGQATLSRVWLHEPRTEGPWFWFDFDLAGRIIALGQAERGPD